MIEDVVFSWNTARVDHPLDVLAVWSAHGARKKLTGDAIVRLGAGQKPSVWKDVAHRQTPAYQLRKRREDWHSWSYKPTERVCPPLGACASDQAFASMRHCFATDHEPVKDGVELLGSNGLAQIAIHAGIQAAQLIALHRVRS